MNKMLVTLALGAGMVSTPVLAQDTPGGRMMEDMTREQAQRIADSLFQKLDLNHDGKVTRQEAEQARQQMGFSGERAAKMIDRTFAGSQSLTLQEFQAQSLVRFERQDLNHDGIVSAAEREQARASRRAMGESAQ